jgi:hypothetical protein
MRRAKLAAPALRCWARTAAATFASEIASTIRGWLRSRTDLGARLGWYDPAVPARPAAVPPRSEGRWVACRELSVGQNVTSRDAGAATPRHREDARFVRGAEPVALRCARIAARGRPTLARAARYHRRAVAAVRARPLAAARGRVEVTRTARECRRGRCAHASGAGGEPGVPAEPQDIPAAPTMCSSCRDAGVDCVLAVEPTLSAERDCSRRLDAEPNDRQEKEQTRERGEYSHT